MLMRDIGRLAFPIFAFLLVEGYLHTKDKRKYGRNLLIFAFISEIPWDLVHKNSFLFLHQNVMFTLFLGFLGIYFLETYNRNRYKLSICLVGLLLLTYLLHADYGIAGLGFILLLYVMRNNKLLMTVIGAGYLPNNTYAALAFIPINLYNGKRGFIKGKILKYVFYLFYPVHLLILWYIKYYIL